MIQNYDEYSGMKLSKLFKEFFASEKSGGIILLACTVISLVLTNSRFHAEYLSIWNLELAHHSVTHWINDGLMVIFFLLVGLELEREIYIGELSNIKNSLLPVFGALGGMIVPASIHLALNNGTPYQAGAGIPMATDIAFALGALSLLGNRVPVALKVFLTALAVIDDLGAILVIAIFYTGSIEATNLVIAGLIFLALLGLNRLRVHTLWPYLIAGVVMWYYTLHSGVHATIAGVLLAFAIPFGDGSERSPSYKLQHVLHKPVAFVILPLFALANTALTISAHWYQVLLTSNSLGIIAGLLVGKPLGIVSFAYLAVASGLSRLAKGVKVKHMIGIGLLGGIGFTMSIFISLLAFDNADAVAQSKIAIMIGSLISGTLGYIVLSLTLPRQKTHKG